jgi:uncharacterized protein DUF6069
MPTTTSTVPSLASGRAAASGSAPRRPITIGVAAAASLAIWGTCTASGMTLHQPASGSGTAAPTLALALVIAVPALAALAGWAIAAFLERRTARAARSWPLVTGLALILSLAGPLSGHGVSAGNRLVLVSMHLTVGAVIIYGMRPQRRT